MARTKNPLLTGVKLGHGKIDPGFILKTRNGKVFISKYPDMGNVIPSELQLKSNSRFAAAIKYAKDIINDPVKKATYKVRAGTTVYHAAIKDYLESH